MPPRLRGRAHTGVNSTLQAVYSPGHSIIVIDRDVSKKPVCSRFSMEAVVARNQVRPPHLTVLSIDRLSLLEQPVTLALAGTSTPAGTYQPVFRCNARPGSRKSCIEVPRGGVPTIPWCVNVSRAGSLVAAMHIPGTLTLSPGWSPWPHPSLFFVGHKANIPEGVTVIAPVSPSKLVVG